MVPINPNCTPKYDCGIGNVMEYVLYFVVPGIQENKCLISQLHHQKGLEQTLVGKITMYPFKSHNISKGRPSFIPSIFQSYFLCSLFFSMVIYFYSYPINTVKCSPKKIPYLNFPWFHSSFPWCHAHKPATTPSIISPSKSPCLAKLTHHFPSFS
jgi:hypothetical protein